MSRQRYIYYLGIASSFAFYCLVKINPIQAQIIPDNTLPVNSTIATECNICTIEGGTVRDRNLFHSFREFSIPTNGEAFFNNALQIENIFSRVTGSLVSDIDGQIRANGSANLFLINPNGIVFGPNAKLNIGGSFIASTAESIIFEDATQFNATNPQASSLLTISVPIGLQFGETAQTIRNQSQATDTFIISIPGLGEIEMPFPVGLRVPSGKTLALVGGDIALENGRLTALTGRIELGSVAPLSLVKLNPVPDGLTLGFEGVENLQDIQLSQDAQVNTGGFLTVSGNIQVQGRRVELTEGSFIISLNEGSLDGGSISVKAEQLILQNGSQIRVETSSTGRSGNLIVTANIIELIGTSGLNPSGLFSQTRFFNLGNAGDLIINTEQLNIRDGAQVSASTFGNGQGGTVNINASDSVEINDRSIDGRFASGLLAQTSEEATGDGGSLTVNTRKLIVQDGAEVSVGAVDNSIGQGGDLQIRASDSVEVAGFGIDEMGQVKPSILLAESQGFGDAGNLDIETNQLIVQEGAELTVSATGEGNAGNLHINTNSILLDNQGVFNAETRAGEGNITLQSQEIVLLNNSNITTNATGEASGGNININTDVLALLENSKITANAIQGKGGNIQIATQGLFLSPNSGITATSDFGLDGIVNINSPEIDPNQGIIELPEELVDVASLINQNLCTVSRGSKFIVTGRSGLPNSPNEVFSADTLWEDWRLAELRKQPVGIIETDESELISISNHNRKNKQRKIVEAQGWIINSEGKIELIAEPLTATFQNIWLTIPFCQLIR